MSEEELEHRLSALEPWIQEAAAKIIKVLPKGEPVAMFDAREALIDLCEQCDRFVP